jgi:hypothetical protein
MAGAIAVVILILLPNWHLTILFRRGGTLVPQGSELAAIINPRRLSCLPSL